MTALIDKIGYEKAEDIAVRSEREGRGVRELVVAEGLMTEAEFDAAVSPQRVTRLGRSRSEDGNWLGTARKTWIRRAGVVRLSARSPFPS